MFFDRYFRKKRLDSKVQAWLDKQSHAEDALSYLIEKELYEHGVRDLSYMIPRKRNDAYFGQLLDKESHNHRVHSNLAMYDAIAQVQPELEAVKSTSRPVHPPKTPAPRTTQKVGTIPAAKGHRTSLAGVNKGKNIYNRTSSAVVVTAPEDTFEHDVDLTCFDD